MAKSETKKDLFQFHLSNEERAPGCLGDLLGMNSCPVMQGLFQNHKMRIPEAINPPTIPMESKLEYFTSLF